MRWTSGGPSPNIEDRRGGGGGFGGKAPMGIGGMVVLLVLSLVFGRDFISGGGEPTQSAPGEVGKPVAESPDEQREVKFVGVVVDSIESTWQRLMPNRWHNAKLVLFRGSTPTGCGVGQAAMGPFYCPQDEKVYIDLSFYDDLKSRFGAGGDFAEAYVIAHEFGHHVQHLLGTDAQVRAQGNSNALSVRLELQADCYAGVWAHEAQRENMLQTGDVEEGLNAAAAVGDDRIQKATTGHVNSDSFTHGSSSQRVSWFQRGLATGRPEDCDTFGGR
jgi:predicted metalloprotease